MAGFFDGVENSVIKISRIGGILCGLYVLMYAVVIFLSQIVHWLKYGIWIKIGVIELFRYYAPFANRFFEDPLSVVPESFKGSWPWIIYPTSWIGLHKVTNFVLEGFPLSLAFGLFGVCLIAWMVDKTDK